MNIIVECKECHVLHSDKVSICPVCNFDPRLEDEIEVSKPKPLSKKVRNERYKIQYAIEKGWKDIPNLCSQQDYLKYKGMSYSDIRVEEDKIKGK